MSSATGVWKYFEKKADKAACKICKKHLSLGSLAPKKQTTTNIKNHLKTIHRKEWEEFVAEQAEFENAAKQKKLKRPQSCDAIPAQPTLPEVLERSHVDLWPDDHPVSLQIDKSIMELIAVDMLPYNIVEGSAFKRLKFSNPNLPSRYRQKTEKYFRTTLMPATYQKVKEKVIERLTAAEWISFTTDIWSNSAKTCSLLSFTAHFIEGPCRLKLVLGALVLDDDHTGINIATKLMEVITEYGINDKIHLAVRDNARNMGAAMRIADFSTIGCVAHTLQLVINDSIFKDQDIELILKKCRDIVGHFKRSEQASRYLRKFQHTCELPVHSLLQDIAVRWNSTYLMLERLFEQKTAINLYMAERGGIDVPTVGEWMIINNIVSVLKHFYEATLDLSADSSCASIVIPLIQMLNSKLQPNLQDSEKIIMLRRRLRKSLNERFAYINTCSELAIATFLDPRFKDRYFTDANKLKFSEEIKNFLNLTISTTSPHEISIPTDHETPSKESLWDSHDKLSVLQTDPISPRISPFEDQLKLYLSEPLVQRNANIYSYWDSSPFIYLKKVALKYLSAPPSSVASEQLFSAAGQLYSDRRSCLLGENADKLLFLAYNIKLFNFEY